MTSKRNVAKHTEHIKTYFNNISHRFKNDKEMIFTLKKEIIITSCITAMDQNIRWKIRCWKQRKRHTTVEHIAVQTSSAQRSRLWVWPTCDIAVGDLELGVLRLQGLVLLQQQRLQRLGLLVVLVAHPRKLNRLHDAASQNTQHVKHQYF